MKKIFVQITVFLTCFLFTGSVWATTRYIATTGNDTTGNGTFATPWKTLTKATSTASADGDTIIIGDGVYDEASYVQPSRKNLTFLPTTDYGCTIKAASGTDRVLHLNRISAGGSQYTFGKIIIDAQNTQVACISTDGGNTIDTLTFNGTALKNPTSFIFNLVKVSNLVMDSEWSTVCTGAAYIRYHQNSAGNCSITNGTATVTGATGALVTAIDYGPSVPACNLVISGNTFNVTTAAAGTPVDGIWASGGTTYSIFNNTININTATTSTAVHVYLHASISATACNIYNNNYVSGSGTGGYGIAVGSDSDTSPSGANTISGVVIYNNQVSKVNHGIFCGWVTGAKVFGNVVKNGVIGVIGKHTTTSEFSKNIVVGGALTSGGLRSKGGTNDVFRENSVFLDSGKSSYGMNVDAAAVNIIMKNNFIYANDNNILKLVKVEDTSTATFSDNVYWSGSAPPANAWEYQTVMYQTIAAWQAAGYDVRSVYAKSSPYNSVIDTTSRAVNSAGIQISGAPVRNMNPAFGPALNSQKW